MTRRVFTKGAVAAFAGAILPSTLTEATTQPLKKELWFSTNWILYRDENTRWTNIMHIDGAFLRLLSPGDRIKMHSSQEGKTTTMGTIGRVFIDKNGVEAFQWEPDQT